MKSEPDVFSIDDLKKRKSEPWDGVRNYQARNYMRDDMKKGNQVLFYHSNANPPGVAGIAEIVREGHPDYTSWDPQSKYFDDKSSPQSPRWFMVEVKFIAKFKNFIPLDTIKNHPELSQMRVAQKGARLSVQPVDEKHFKLIKKMGG